MVLNKGLGVSFKVVITLQFTVVHPSIKIITDISELNVYLVSSLYIYQNSTTVTSGNPGIFYSLFTFFLCNSMLLTNIGGR